jgi:prophage maintenance system killer protein
VLAHGIAEGQIFVDRNKRTGLEAMRLFLDINGVVLRAPQAELAGWLLDLAAGTTPEELAERIRGRIELPERHTTYDQNRVKRMVVTQ